MSEDLKMSHLQLIKRIKYFERFDKGWDGEDGEPPSQKTSTLAKQIANSLPQSENWFVTLTIEGAILFESDDGLIKVFCNESRS